MKTKYLPTLLLLLAPALHAAQPDGADVAALLNQLDAAIENKAHYHELREEKTRTLKLQAARQRGAARIETYKKIFGNYLHEQTDSAAHYLALMAAAPEAETDAGLRNYICIGRAEYYAVTGQYIEAKRQIVSVERAEMDEAMRLYFYHTQRRLNGWMADYASGKEMQERYKALTQLYRDSILLYEPEGSGRNVVLADRAINEGDTETALQLCLRDLDETKGKPMVYTYYNLAECYRLKGNRLLQTFYLAKTALRDIEEGVAEYQALPHLAHLLYEDGDVKRAYEYLLCSIEDANLCKAPLRSIEASGIFPIVDKAYKQQEKARRAMERGFFAGLVVLILLLALMIVWLRRQMRKLKQTRRELAAANAELSRVNEEMKLANENIRQVNADLVLTDKMKEEYIARYLDRCRNYLDALDNYRRSLLKLAKSGQTEQLTQQLKSEAWVREEQQRFYADFDRSFLNLFPHFIERFNNLLQPEARIQPKSGELLNTELRIFALIRLGVNESQRIAHFLNYSLTTIYNYRSKFRNKAIGPKEQFEKEVMAL